MQNYDFITDKAIQKMVREIPDGTLLNYLGKEKKNTSVFKQVRIKDIDGNGKVHLADHTHLLSGRIEKAVAKADQTIKRGRDIALSGSEMQRLKQGAELELFKDVEKIKQDRIGKLLEQLDKNVIRERNGNGKNPTERLLKLQTAQMEAAAMTENQIGSLMQKYEKDPLQAVDRTMVTLFAAHKDQVIQKKARSILAALPAGAGSTIEDKKIQLELVSLYEAPVGGFQYFKADGVKLGTINSADLMEGNTTAPTADDILNEK